MLRRTGELKTGDRIVEVDGQPILSSNQDQAVAAIAGAGNPLKIKVQSLQSQKVSVTARFTVAGRLGLS